MQLPEDIEAYGVFWLPDQTNNRIPGILRISEQGEASLELFGSFQPSSGYLSDDNLQPIPLIHGATDKTGAVTLTQCFNSETTTTVNITTLSKSTYEISHVLGRSHFSEEPIEFSGMSFSVEGLNEWFSLYHRVFSHGRDPLGSMSVTYNAPEPISFDLSDDLKIGFYMSASSHSGMFEQSVTTAMKIQVESKRLRCFDEFMDVLRKVRNFLCLAFDQRVAFTSITGYRGTPGKHISGSDVVDVYGVFDVQPLVKQEIGPGRFLFRFEDVANVIHEYLPRWLERYEEYEPTFDLYFAVAGNHYMYLEGRLLFLVHGIESLHRRSSDETRMPAEEFDTLLATVKESVPTKWRSWLMGRLRYANELSLRRRIGEMITPFEELFGPGPNREAFIGDVVNTRNYLTHYDSSVQDKAVTDPSGLIRLYDRLEGLVQLHLLELLGFEHDVIKSIAAQYEPLRRKLQIG